MNEVINKRCFIKKGEYTYCSKCGKEILNSSLEFHAKQCGFKSRDFVREFNEEDYAYAFKILEGSKRSVLKFYVFKPVLVKDNIDGISRGEWEEVYNCSLLRDSKKIIEDKPYKKGYEYYLPKCVACLNHTEYEAVRRFFSIPEIESLEMLFYLYKTQSFHVNETMCIFHPNHIEEKPLNMFLEWVRENVEYKHWYMGHLHRDEDLWRHQTILWFELRKIETNEIID